MKVAISVPDPLFEAAERESRRLRIPRSRFYARALEAFLHEPSSEEITKRLNDVCSKVGSLPDPYLERASLEVLRRETW